MIGRFTLIVRLAALLGLLLAGVGLPWAGDASAALGIPFDAPICHAAAATDAGGDPAAPLPAGHDHRHCNACQPAGPPPDVAVFRTRIAAQPTVPAARRLAVAAPAMPCAGFASRAPPSPMI